MLGTGADAGRWLEAMRRAARPLLYAGRPRGRLRPGQGPRRLHRALRPHRLVPLRLDARLRRASCASPPTASGCPTCPAPGRPRSSASVGAACARRGRRSRCVQLFVGDALLPRFVVFGVGPARCPTGTGSASGLAAGGRLRAEARDRVVVVGRPDEVAALELELARPPERPASIVGQLSTAEAAPVGERRRPLVDARRATGADRCVVLDRAAQDDAGDRGPGRGAPRAGRAGPHAVAVLRGVARQAARRPSSSGPRCSSTSASSTGPRYGRAKRLARPRRSALVGLRRARRSSMPGRLASATSSATGARCSTARSGSARAATPSRSSSSAR